MDKKKIEEGVKLILEGIGEDVKLDLTTLWLKHQTVKGCLAYGYQMEKGKRVYTFQMALDMIAKKKVEVEDMLTHTFSLEKYQQMVTVNLNKSKYNAIKTAVRFN